MFFLLLNRHHQTIRLANFFSLHSEIKYDILTGMINVEIVKNNNENNLGLIRRFSKKIKTSGILKKVRSVRYNQRSLSKFTKKKKALKTISKKAEIDEMIKLGKMPEKKTFSRR